MVVARRASCNTVLPLTTQKLVNTFLLFLRAVRVLPLEAFKL
jgi:hypothetical protein